jgi:molybdenum cofactor cytidylyltransferase
MGEPKQLLQFQDETLLRRSAKIALAVSNRVVVMLGFRIGILKKEILDLPVEAVENIEWETGMSGSIKIGLEKLLAEDSDKLKAVIIMACDQPLVDEKLLGELIENYENANSLIVASEYQNTLGVPALFSAQLFPELLTLDSQTGAKQLIKKYQAQAISISCPEGAFDIDTPADYDNLLKNFS